MDYYEIDRVGNNNFRISLKKEKKVTYDGKEYDPNDKISFVDLLSAISLDLRYYRKPEIVNNKLIGAEVNILPHNLGWDWGGWRCRQ